MITAPAARASRKLSSAHDWGASNCQTTTDAPANASLTERIAPPSSTTLTSRALTIVGTPSGGGMTKPTSVALMDAGGVNFLRTLLLSTTIRLKANVGRVARCSSGLAGACKT